jgi:hypothetical protein
MVGPQVGKDLREKALLAMFYTLLFITIYISGRFEFKWMVSGIMAAALAGETPRPTKESWRPYSLEVVVDEYLGMLLNGQTKESPNLG